MNLDEGLNEACVAKVWVFCQFLGVYEIVVELCRCTRGAWQNLICDRLISTWIQCSRRT